VLAQLLPVPVVAEKVVLQVLVAAEAVDLVAVELAELVLHPSTIWVQSILASVI
jgi:hypothetical protein